MIPQNISLVKCDNPGLVSRNTDKSWRVSSHIFQMLRRHAGHLYGEQLVSTISSFTVLRIVKNKCYFTSKALKKGCTRFLTYK